MGVVMGVACPGFLFPEIGNYNNYISDLMCYSDLMYY